MDPLRQSFYHLNTMLKVLDVAAGCTNFSWCKDLYLYCWGGGIFFVRPLDDLVAQSGTNNLCRSQNSKNPDRLKFLSVTNQFRENHPKRFKLQI